jgi:hypothetical protein
MNKARVRHLALAVAAGLLSFWSPIVIVRFIFDSDWGVLLTVFPLTVLLPALACLVLEAFTDKSRQPRLGFSCAMVLGIWITAPLSITLASTAVPGQGFHMSGAWSYVGVTTTLFPLSVIMMSTYDGSLFALLFTSVTLLLFSAMRWSF